MRLDDLAGYGKAEAGAGEAAFASLAAEELREDARLVFSRDSDALVSNLHAHNVALDCSAHLDRASVR